MKFKWVYLFLGLLFPLLISLFLRYFGKNEFNIPVYFKNGVDSLKSNCAFDYSKPYVVPDSVFAFFNKDTHSTMLVTIDSSAEAKKNFSRLDTEVGTTGYNFVSLKSDSLNQSLISCVLFLNKPWTTVLIDKENRIRGYYAPNTLEETDRLIVEMKILLKQY
jgi:protein SCO1/2